MTRNNNSNQLDHSPIHLLHRAGQCAGDIFHAEMKDGDLTPRQLAVLLTVAHDEGLSQTGLVEYTGIDRSTLADIVRRLQTKGLLKRRRTKADARAYAVKLTDEGRRALASPSRWRSGSTSAYSMQCRRGSATSSSRRCSRWWQRWSAPGTFSPRCVLPEQTTGMHRRHAQDRTPAQFHVAASRGDG